MRSSVPRVAQMKFMQSKSNPKQQEEEDLSPLDIKDTAFSVHSDPKFLYLIGKICTKSQLLAYSDLALHSFHDHLLIATYYRTFLKPDEYLSIKIKTYLWLARLFLAHSQI